MTATALALKVALGAALLGASAGLIGTFAVLRRQALLGDMLAHAALPGICLAFLLTGLRDPLVLSLGALGTGLVGVMALALARRWTRTREDAAMGVVLSSFFGVGVLLLTVIQKNPTGSQAGLDSYLFGEIASLQNRDVLLLGVLAAGLVVLFFVSRKELTLLCFDDGFARSQGWPTVLMDFLVMASVAVVTVLGLPICGVVLIAAMLIYPCAAARFWTNRLGAVAVLACLIGAVAGGAGVLIASPIVSAESTLGALLRNQSGSLPPPGPMIVLCGAVLFGFSTLFAPERGLVARVWRNHRLQRKVQREHLLRSLYELTEKQGPPTREISPAELATRYRAEPWAESWTLARAERRGLIDRNAESVRLTPSGAVEAARVTRVHRLWELYLVRHADIAADHVDRDADDVEHLLPPELIDRLEADMTREYPSSAAPEVNVPPSPHEIET
ncbi:Manganese transport system membrane protein MntB [Pseudobythopirellula maris]|uniref:Manganese transport system membrane protein MntB n=1 Tax=Pseudobythopirellula maris TaxID=2527991 RepID=A0A5C5ZSM7_9BACT|nr:iron chelate uptake ABC transporter family permease subunit [Pseudobythopirellula maris]TWT89987.1 Manganese transport system membrane protein MntB [Pseudobythopirellula maris]